MQIVLNGLIIGSVYALLGMGFSLLYSTVRYFNLAYGVTAVWGVFVMWMLMEKFAFSFAAALVLGSLFAVILGILSYRFLFRWMVKRKCSNLVILVASFGLLVMLQNLAALIWGDGTRSLSLSEKIVPAYDFFGLFITANQMVMGATAVVIMLLLELLLHKTSFGLALRAIGDNQELTRILGLNTEKIILWVFALASFLGALCAGLYSLEIGIRPTYAISFVLSAVICSIIGGLGSVRGALVGGLLLGVVENIGTYYIGYEWRDLVAFGFLTFFLLFKPEGLFAKRKLIGIS